MARTTQAPWAQPFQVLRPSGPAAELDRHRAWRPSVVEDADSVLRMWYSGHDGAVARILRAEQRPRQGWKRLGISVDAGLAGATDAGGVEAPSVVPTSDGYVMAYTGSDGTHTRTHLATSDDGEDWKASGPLRLRGGPGARTTSPCLVATQAGLWLYQAGEGDDGRAAIRVASPAADGAWDHAAVVLAPRADERGLTAPWVVAEGGTATMFFVSHDAEGSTAIEVATSGDLVRWERRATPLGVERRHHDRGPIGHPSAVRLPTGDLRLFYAAGAEDDDSGACRLFSTDLLYGASP